MTLEDKVNAIEHKIMMNEELISRDEVITLIARKHLSKEENFHGAITRLNSQVKALKPITIKDELAKILDEISAEIERLDTESWELSVTDVLNVIDRYREEVSK